MHDINVHCTYSVQCTLSPCHDLLWTIALGKGSKKKYLAPFPANLTFRLFSSKSHEFFLPMIYARNMITWEKSFGRIDHRCDQNHWPGSSACSSRLPRPGLLQRVSQVIVKPTDLKRRNSPHSWHEIVYFVFHFAIFCQGATTAAPSKETTSRACEKAVSGFQ